MTTVLVIIGALALGLAAGAVLIIARRRGEAEVRRELEEREAEERAAAIAREELGKITLELRVDTTPLELAFARIGLALAYQRLAWSRAARAFAEVLAAPLDEPAETGYVRSRTGEPVDPADVFVQPDGTLTAFPNGERVLEVEVER